jgi:hypothetical protein
VTKQVAGLQHNPARDPYDDYPTDPLWTKALTDRVRLRGPLWEPAAGDGQMVDELRGQGYDVRATDLVRTGDDFLSHRGEWAGSIVTNPPYRHVDEFLRTALESATEQVAMLLPIHGLGGKKRSEWLWSKQPPALVMVVPRRMVVLGRSSQFCHVWCVWDSQCAGPTEFDWGLIPSEYKRLRHPAESPGYQHGHVE